MGEVFEAAPRGIRDTGAHGRQILDEEIGRLPERFRAAAVLCYLEGKSVDEAARLLGCPRGTVASRLVRARQRLRLRLCRRGLAVTAALAALHRANAAPRPLVRIPALTAAALHYAQGGAAVGAVPPRLSRGNWLHRTTPIPSEGGTTKSRLTPIGR